MQDAGGSSDSQRGLVLYASLLILSLLMAIGVGAFVSTQNNFKISGNLKGESIAFYLAEAGIEWSKNEIARATTHPPDSLNFNHSLAGGTFSVSAVSSVALSALAARSVVRSTGEFTRSSSTIQAQLTKTFDLGDAAMALRGNFGRTQLAGDSFLLSGMDHDPLTGQMVPGTGSYPGISVPDESIKSRVESALSGSQLDNIEGTDQNGAPIASSESLPSHVIASLAHDLCRSAHATVVSIPVEGDLFVENQTWGSRASPQLRCVEGLGTGGDLVRFNGNFSGAGILVVRNADLVLAGTYRWDGLIVVTGENVAFKVVGEDVKEIYGSLIVNETSANPEPNALGLDIQGAIRVLFSRVALGGVAALVPSTTLNAIYGALPYRITQNYWRIVTP